MQNDTQRIVTYGCSIVNIAIVSYCNYSYFYSYDIEQQKGTLCAIFH